MLNTKFVMLALAFTLLAGCSTGPQMQMFTDGKIYYPNWSKYDHCRNNGSGMECTKNNVYVETIYPLTAEQISFIKYRNQQNQQEQENFNRAMDSFGESMDSISRNTPKTTYTNCYNTFGNSVNCTSTRY